jgi:hypothetical protein
VFFGRGPQPLSARASTMRLPFSPFLGFGKTKLQLLAFGGSSEGLEKRTLWNLPWAKREGGFRWRIGGASVGHNISRYISGHF